MTEANELVKYQRELKEEEELIVSMLSKIDEQLHALQVEQLHLANASNSGKQTKSASQDSVSTNTVPMETNVKKELDLEVPNTWQESENDEEDDSN
ncbi:snRNA-activating protein complex subunit 5-like [Diprion similis]|uniref:snRNA-activating protein complex subunit 5-like n=1 Tax=Diprion similis TaxID=362088 RepID=UPI001EF8D515|nr:snRNA-activating protein complex subunit 5-like [Diprion similis]